MALNLPNPFGSTSALESTPEKSAVLETATQAVDTSGPLKWNIEKVVVPPRLRELHEETVCSLVTSIRQCQLIDPISVRLGEDYAVSGHLTLVAGLHRLEAARRLGWSTVDVRIINADETTAGLIEIDSNLIRLSLSPAEEAHLFGVRRRLHEQKHGPAKARGARAANQIMGRGSPNASANLTDAFSASAAQLTGKSQRAAQRSAARGEALGPRLLERVRGTKLDRGVILDRLMTIPPEAREEFVEHLLRKAKADRSHDSNRTTKRATSNLMQHEGDPEDLRTLMTVWNSASEKSRREFLKRIVVVAV
ncbi:ParB-like chromosome segregation protein Spo0J [Nitrobacteraceae bacterium AZCC 2146]